MARITGKKLGEKQAGAPAWRRHIPVLLLVALLSGLYAPGVWSLDTKIMQAQQRLGVLGYDPGMADGLLGPRTREALKAFQQDHELPITGMLDLQTREALGFVTFTAPSAMIPSRPPPVTPWRAVLTYLRYYDTQPARLLPYVTERFRQGLSPYAWIKQTSAMLAAQHFLRLSWQIERVDLEADVPAPTHATVYVQSRVQLAGKEAITRQEIFSLVPADETGWRIDAWRSEPVTSTPSQTSPPGGGNRRSTAAP